MTTTKDEKHTICDACRKVIKDNSGIRKINGYTLHLEEVCFQLYTEKVVKGFLKIEYKVPEKKR